MDWKEALIALDAFGSWCIGCLWFLIALPWLIALHCIALCLFRFYSIVSILFPCFDSIPLSRCRCGEMWAESPWGWDGGVPLHVFSQTSPCKRHKLVYNLNIHASLYVSVSFTRAKYPKDGSGRLCAKHLEKVWADRDKGVCWRGDKDWKRNVSLGASSLVRKKPQPKRTQTNPAIKSPIWSRISRSAMWETWVMHLCYSHESSQNAGCSIPSECW